MRSEQIKTGVERTPNRSLLYALGYTDEELSRPLIGVVSSYNEIVPGHIDRKSTRLNSSHQPQSRMPSSA